MTEIQQRFAHAGLLLNCSLVEARLGFRIVAFLLEEAKVEQ